MAKKIALDLAYEFLGEEPPESTGDKKSINAEKKKIKELRETHPIQIAVAFKVPWWVIVSDGEVK